MSFPAFRPLGDLEQAIMSALWLSPPASVRDIAHVLEERQLAYTTIMTTLDRLFKKGLLLREKQSHAFLYRPAMEREAYERKLVSDVLEQLPTASKGALLSGFLDFAATDEATLAELERLVAERKREDQP